MDSKKLIENEKILTEEMKKICIEKYWFLIIFQSSRSCKYSTHIPFNYIQLHSRERIPMTVQGTLIMISECVLEFLDLDVLVWVLSWKNCSNLMKYFPSEPLKGNVSMPSFQTRMVIIGKQSIPRPSIIGFGR